MSFCYHQQYQPGNYEDSELKNIMYLVLKNIWNSVKPGCKNRSQVIKITFQQIVPVLLQCFVKVLEKHNENLFEGNFCGLGILSFGGLLTLCCDTDSIYKYSLCSNYFFCSLPNELICIISGKNTRSDFYHISSTTHDLFTYQKFCTCVDNAFFVPFKLVSWQSLERQREKNGLKF